MVRVFTFLIIAFLFSGKTVAQSYFEVFSQNVALWQYDENVISQNILTWNQEREDSIFYLGVYIDQDRLTGADAVYTDVQVSPLVGLKSKVMWQSLLPSRFFGEARAVYRTVNFSDDRLKEDYELRVGLLGYDYIQATSRFSFEHYYALFYTRLYGERFIFQGWSRQIIEALNYINIFNEVFVDTFDFTRGQDPSIDLRPGVRLIKRFNWGSVSLMHQYVYRTTNLDIGARDEYRTSLIFGANF